MKKYQCMLSTIDNPFNPFEQFTAWLLFDKEKGWNCCEVFDRVANITDEMTQKEINEETERAIDQIIEHDFLNIYKKVTYELKYIENDDTMGSEEV